MIYTGYYANLPDDILIVSISNSQPKGCNFPTLEALAPPWNLVRSFKSGEISWDVFKSMYTSHLDQLPQRVWDDFMNFNGDMLMACWEAPSKNCHRHILRDYMRVKGIPVEEYSAKE